MVEEQVDVISLVRSFKFAKLLDSNPQTKTCAFSGTIYDKPAIISLEKTHFVTEEDVLSNLQNFIMEMKPIACNDIYHWTMITTKSDVDKLPTAKLNLIWPATETHLKKFEPKTYFFIKETPEQYERIVKPYIETMKGERIQWVRNILYNGAEAERVVYNDLDEENGFILLPDMKWDGITMNSLYLVALVYRTDIASVRDLTKAAGHVEWLKSLVKKIRQAVPKAYKYQIRPDELRLFIHYQPSYYHFHIHVVHMSHPGLGQTILAGRAMIVEDVISKLELLDDRGYAGTDIYYGLESTHDLYALGLGRENTRLLQEQGILSTDDLQEE